MTAAMLTNNATLLPLEAKLTPATNGNACEQPCPARYGVRIPD